MIKRNRENPYYAVIEINTIKEFETFSVEFNNILKSYVFRGQQSDNWELQPSIERTISNELIHRYESYTIDEFKRHSFNYVDKIPQSLLEWIALIQHYGGPTRLLDFTHSLFIAVFFALLKTMKNYRNNKDTALWGININKLRYCIQQQNSEILKVDNKSKILERVIYDKENFNLVMYAEPFYVNKRLSAQQGLFLFSTNSNSAFQKTLFNTFGIRNTCRFNNVNYNTYDVKGFLDANIAPDVIKIVLSQDKGLHKKLLRYLCSMNINARTLFPDIDGLAMSLHNITCANYWSFNKDRM